MTFAAQVGWLVVKPEGQDHSRAELYGEELPDLPASEILADAWRQLGCAGRSFNGPVPFEWREVAAFSEMTGAALTPIEAECLVDMSRVYCTELANTSALRKAPMER